MGDTTWGRITPPEGVRQSEVINLAEGRITRASNGKMMPNMQHQNSRFAPKAELGEAVAASTVTDSVSTVTASEVNTLFMKRWADPQGQHLDEGIEGDGVEQPLQPLRRSAPPGAARC